jgi:hypothetical protein
MTLKTNNTPFGKLQAKTVGEVRQTYKPGNEAKLLIRDEMTPRDYFHLLRDKGLSIEAVSFLAHALPRREAIWWCSQCARLACLGPLPLALETALFAAEEWTKTPREEYCQLAQTVIDSSGASETPTGCVALATFWCGSSLAPPGTPPAPPGEHMMPTAVFGAVILSAGWRDPKEFASRLQEMLDLGAQVADGSNRWPEPPPKR